MRQGIKMSRSFPALAKFGDCCTSKAYMGIKISLLYNKYHKKRLQIICFPARKSKVEACTHNKCKDTVNQGSEGLFH